MLTAAAPAPLASALIVPSDFSRAVIELDVTVKGEPLRMLLDTGVDPSAIDLAVADRLGLAVDRSDAGEASGFGDGKGATVFPAPITDLAIQRHGFGRFDALAVDMRGISAGLGRRLDGVLGSSFLSDKVLLIDYPARRVAILAHAGDAAALVAGCRTHWATPLKTVDSFPIIPDFRFGAAQAPVSLDTGSTGSVGLFQSAFELPGVRAALRETGSVTRTGAKGQAKSVRYSFEAPVGFGPFSLPPGVSMSSYSEAGSADTRVANVGNGLMAALKLKLLLDYPGRTMAFHGDCEPGPAPQ